MPRSTSGSPSALISQSNTATIAAEIVRVEHHVVELEVAVDDRRRRRIRAADASRSHSASASISGSGVVFDRCHRSVQPRTWRSTKPAGLPSAAQPRRGDVDRVEIGERVDERFAQRGARRGSFASAGGSSSRTTRPRRRSIA